MFQKKTQNQIACYEMWQKKRQNENKDSNDDKCCTKLNLTYG